MSDISSKQNKEKRHLFIVKPSSNSIEPYINGHGDSKQ